MFQYLKETLKQLKQNQRTTIDVIGKVTMNTFKGESNLQVMVEDFDIKETQQYYF